MTEEQAPKRDVLWAVQELEWRAKARVDQGGITLEDELHHQILMAFQEHCRTLANALEVMTERALKAEGRRDLDKEVLDLLHWFAETDAAGDRLQVRTLSRALLMKLEQGS